MKTIEELEKQVAAISEQIKALKDKPKFEVGKWYGNKEDDEYEDCLINLNEIGSDGLAYGYGFVSGVWKNNRRVCKKRLTPATPEEVKAALVKEAEKRGFKEGVMLCGKIGSKRLTPHLQKWNYTNYNRLELYGSNVFDKGQWATIIKDYVIKVGGYDVKKEVDPYIIYKIGCKNIALVEVVRIRDIMQIHNFKKVSFDGIETDLETINKILSL